MLIVGILSALPHLIRVAAWTVAVIFAAIMVRDGGGRPERCFLIGTSLMLASSVVASTAAGLMPWLISRLGEAAHDYAGIGSVLSAIHLVNSFIALGGIIVLVYAFWRKFRIPAPAVRAE